MVNSALVASLGSPSCRSGLTGFPSQPLESNEIALKETLLVYVQHVLLQDLGKAFFFHLSLKKE